MKITKVGHCCLVIEMKGKKIVTDPGSFTVEANKSITGVDYILFTHEHGDHYHLDSLKALIKNNPQAVIYTNNSVSELLDKEGITHTKVNHGDTVMLGEVVLKGIGEKHAEMHSSIPLSSNIGFFIDERLWYPGDAFTLVEQPVEILALPVAGPWMKISEAIDYAVHLKPKVLFQVHDGIIKDSFKVFFPTTVNRVLKPLGLELTPFNDGETKEF